MAELAVSVRLVADDSTAVRRDDVRRAVESIVARPELTLADLPLLGLQPRTHRDSERSVNRAKPTRVRNQIRSEFLTEATQELFEQLGETERTIVQGSVIYRWDLGEGDGLVIARKSSEERNDGQTIGDQIRTVLESTRHAGLAPRYVFAALNLSGRTHFDERHDFTEVFERFQRGEITWVAYRGVDRLARSMTWTALFVHYLREYDIGLHVAQLGSSVDLHNPFALTQLWSLAMAAEIEWASSNERMQTGFSRQMRDAGKGWSNSGGFGFRRDDNKYLVIDEEDWDYVLLIHQLYARLQSISKVIAELDEQHNRQLSRALVSRILRDPMYLTGVFRTKDPASPDGHRTDQIVITRPISASLWEHNQGVLDAQVGRSEHRDPGAIGLQGTPIYCSRCMDHHDPTESESQLRIRWNGKRYVLNHAAASAEAGWSVPSQCRGFSLPAGEVEAAVVRALRELVSDDAGLKRAIARAHGADVVDDTGGILTPQDRRRLRDELRRLGRHADGLWQEHIRSIAEGRDRPHRSIERETDLINREAAAIRARLELDTRLRERKPVLRSSPPPGLLDLLTETAPDDPDKRIRRWLVIRHLVDHIVIWTDGPETRIDVVGPLVPAPEAAVFDPLERVADEIGRPSRPAVPQPFAISTKRERLAPAYKLCVGISGRPATPLTRERIAAVLTVLAEQYPTGPLLGRGAVPASRWNAYADAHGMQRYERVYAFLKRDLDISVREMVVDALGARSAVVSGRVRPKGRTEWIWLLEAAYRDGFRFAPGWARRLDAFTAERPYSALTISALRGAARRTDGGLLDGLTREAVEAVTRTS